MKLCAAILRLTLARSDQKVLTCATCRVSERTSPLERAKPGPLGLVPETCLDALSSAG